MTLYRTFSGLTRRYNNLTSLTTKVSGEAGHGDIEDQVILVIAVDHKHNHHQQQLDKNLDHLYETKFLMSSEKGVEYELVIKIENPNGINHYFVNWSIEMTKLAFDVTASAAAVSQISHRVTSPQTNSLLSPTGTSRSNIRSSNVSREAMPHMDAIKEIEQSLEEQSEESGDDVVLNGTQVISSTSTTVSETKAKKMDVSRPASLNVIDRVTINNTLETPRFLNVLAFSKIMKKYDKVKSPPLYISSELRKVTTNH
ncbi:hypothetical protein MKX03_002279 [Papaver bracteatum]|nr:hypothetical protein MKX03_002279 [Papaver bracteatum]